MPNIEYVRLGRAGLGGRLLGFGQVDENFWARETKKLEARFWDTRATPFRNGRHLHITETCHCCRSTELVDNGARERVMRKGDVHVAYIRNSLSPCQGIPFDNSVRLA